MDPDAIVERWNAAHSALMSIWHDIAEKMDQPYSSDEGLDLDARELWIDSALDALALTDDVDEFDSFLVAAEPTYPEYVARVRAAVR